MAQKITALRVVLASPSDVKREREAFAKVIEQVNNDTARPSGFQLDLWRWETDSRPGFNPLGPQGLIDNIVKIEQCDLFVGIFWNRIGSPTKFGITGMEHEFQAAYKAWRSKRSPDIMFYFNEKPSNLTSDVDLAQRGKVLAFKRGFPEEGLYWPYKGHAEFIKYANEHLRRFIHEFVVRRKSGRVKAPRIANPKEKSNLALNPGHRFNLRVGAKGFLKFPAALLKLLHLREGDRPFDPNTATRLMKRMNSRGISLTPRLSCETQSRKGNAMANRASEIKVSKAVVNELRSLSSSDAEIVISFLKHLAENPYDRAVIGAADAKGDLFASSITNKLYVYWSFDPEGHVPELKLQPKINVLGLARKSASRGLVPLLSTANQKLKSA